MLIIGLVIIHLLVIRLTNPLNRHVEQANKIAKSDLTGNIEIVRNDEIGLLGSSFNLMTEKLKEIIGMVIGSANSLKFKLLKWIHPIKPIFID